MLNYFIPGKYKLRPEKIRKSRITILIHILCVLAILYSSLFIFGESIRDVGIISAIMILPSLFLFKKYGSFFLGGNLLTAVVLYYVSFVICNTGYLFSAQIPWLVLAPLLSFFLGGRSSGVFWTILALFVLVHVYNIEINAENSYVNTSHILDSHYRFNGFFVLTFVIVSFLFLLDFDNDLLMRDLRKNRTTLKEQNLLLEAKIKERTQSLVRINDSLQRSNDDLEQFAYVASHDLQEPLRMVGNFVQLLEEEYKEQLDDSGKMYIQYSVEGVARMSRLIEELLEYSRVGRRGDVSRYEDLNKILDNKLLDLSYIIKEKKAIIEIENLPTRVRCISSQIGILFQNLISNGIKFNNSNHPVITIKGQENKNNWMISVSDNGIGIDKAYAERIFEVFKRLHRKEEYPGTGIGLAICKKVVDCHEGRIWIESKVGEGTTFYFTISKYLN